MKIKTKVAFMGGKQAGCIGLLSMFAANCEVVSVVAYDDNVRMVTEQLGIPVFSIRGREII